jgi:hypothetical protein
MLNCLTLQIVLRFEQACLRIVQTFECVPAILHCFEARFCAVFVRTANFMRRFLFFGLGVVFNNLFFRLVIFGRS